MGCENITSLTHAELASYYNEFVIQLKVFQTVLPNHVEKEIMPEERSKVEEHMQEIIYLLDEEILPVFAVLVSVRPCRYVYIALYLRVTS